jgi:hypothetical protein
MRVSKGRIAMKMVCSLLVVFAMTLPGDSLILVNRSVVKGSLIGADSRLVRFAAGDQVKTYSLTEVESICFGELPAATGPVRPSGLNTTAPPEIHAGTAMTVRLIDPVNSEVDQLGQTYRASLDQPLLIGGRVAIARGAGATLTLTSAQHAGHFAGRTVMTLELTELVVNDRVVQVATTNASVSSAARGGRSAGVIGGATALGAVVGGLAGGGRGAAIGSVSGVGAGTLAAGTLAGTKVKLPAETRITFSLRETIGL